MREPPLVVLVCGGRDFTDRAAVFAALDAVLAQGPVHVITGGARGVDSLAIEWAEQRGVSWQTYAADWRRHGNRAGPIRNQQMIDEGKPDFVLGFPGGSGTADMLSRARRAGVMVSEPLADADLFTRSR